MAKTQIISKKGQKLATTHNFKIGFMVAKNRLCDELGRQPRTLNNWAKLAEKGCPDFALCQLQMWDRYPDKTPWHPFQAAILRDINRIQYKGKNPRKNLTKKQVIDFVRSQKYSFEKFVNNF